MSEEEKKAIEQLDYELTDSWVHNKGISKETLTLFKKVIEKQQKEIESLKAKRKELNAITTSCLDTLKKCVHKDTIREILYSNNDDLTIILKIKELIDE